jgi:hypothetical protein
MDHPVETKVVFSFSCYEVHLIWRKLNAKTALRPVLKRQSDGLFLADLLETGNREGILMLLPGESPFVRERIRRKLKIDGAL